MHGVMVDDEKTRILVHVQPNASRNEALCFQDGVLRVRIAARPIKGQANQELIKFLSNTFGVSKSNLTIEKGVTSKRKVISINGLTQIQVMGQLERLGIPV
jgi:hypothetical protein